MPLWHIYHPAGIYTAEQKQALAADVTALYARVGLPKFYAVTLFHEVDESSFYVGGEPRRDAVRVVIEHLARQPEDPDIRRRTGEALARLLAPYTSERGLYYEFHIDETPRDLWMTDGIWPPPAESEAERRWARENRPSPY